MLKLHPEILKRDGQNQFVVLPYEEYKAIREALEDLDDLQVLNQAKAKEGHVPGISLAEIGRRLREKAKLQKSKRAKATA